MTTDVQKIISLSLNKIMASRTRRGGISLHRNLLVAGVLLRAKDAYIAETVAKRKQELDDQQVVPMCTNSNGNTGEPTDEHADSLNDNVSYDSDYSADHLPNSPDNSTDSVAADDLLSTVSTVSDNVTSNNNSESEERKENVDPAVKSDVLPESGCKRKRGFSELEIAISSIEVNDSSDKEVKCKDCSCDKRYFSKIPRLDSIENSCTCDDQITPTNDVISNNDDITFEASTDYSLINTSQYKHRSHERDLNQEPCFVNSQNVMCTPQLSMAHQSFSNLLVATM